MAKKLFGKVFYIIKQQRTNSNDLCDLLPHVLLIAPCMGVSQYNIYYIG